jgi:vacuolar-type H+-ATPase subunit H
MMGTQNGGTSGSGLEVVRRLEHALEESDDAHDVAEATLAAARAEADRLVALARAAGGDAGLRLQASLIADGEADASSIREVGDTEAQDVLEAVSVIRDTLVAEFTTRVLPRLG